MRGMTVFFDESELAKEDKAVNRLSDEGDIRSASRENKVSVPAAYTASFSCAGRWDDGETARIQDERWVWRNVECSYEQTLSFLLLQKTM